MVPMFGAAVGSMWLWGRRGLQGIAGASLAYGSGPWLVLQRESPIQRMSELFHTAQSHQLTVLVLVDENNTAHTQTKVKQEEFALT